MSAGLGKLGLNFSPNFFQVSDLCVRPISLQEGRSGQSDAEVEGAWPWSGGGGTERPGRRGHWLAGSALVLAPKGSIPERVGFIPFRSSFENRYF